jgi:hypothetical protein
VIGRTARCRGINTTEPQLAQIKRLDKRLNHANRIVFGDKIFQLLGKQSALLAVHTLNKMLHQTRPPKHGRIIAQ